MFVRKSLKGIPSSSEYIRTTPHRNNLQIKVRDIDNMRVLN